MANKDKGAHDAAAIWDLSVVVLARRVPRT